MTIIHNDGMVTWSRILRTMTLCDVDSFYYPYDYQACHLILGSRIEPSNFLEIDLQWWNRQGYIQINLLIVFFKTQFICVSQSRLNGFEDYHRVAAEWNETSVETIKHVQWDPSKVWELLAYKYDVTNVTHEQDMSVLTVSFCLARNKAYYETTLLFPLIIMALLTLPGILMPGV